MLKKMDGRKETQKVAGIGKRDMEMQSAAETKPTIVEKRNVTEPESKEKGRRRNGGVLVVRLYDARADY
ncbi:hypothetical protein [Mixta calida]|uniref:hypothetical protein n=1 Tax=Mixta calida TaxID=665913 RepID=UPI000ED4EBB0|nr:hypothetical protein [Mixta calida]MDU4289609.1 hypothetical protein [Mixta calida]HCW47470.1 hypothetical protein [Erwiniaceae bacterium]